MEKLPCIYILASRKNGTLYIGVTSDVVKRVWEHKNNVVERFTKEYGVHLLDSRLRGNDVRLMGTGAAGPDRT